eukprot:1144908-Pelagomonas_calceolata.AAC.10
MSAHGSVQSDQDSCPQEKSAQKDEYTDPHAVPGKGSTGGRQAQGVACVCFASCRTCIQTRLLRLHPTCPSEHACAGMGCMQT